MVITNSGNKKNKLIIKVNGVAIGTYEPSKDDKEINIELADNLTTDDSNKPLSAKQGKVLKTTIDSVNSNLTSSIGSVNTTLTNAVNTKASSSDLSNAVSTLNTAIGGKANSSHTHAQSDITSLVSDLGTKATNKANATAENFGSFYKVSVNTEGIVTAGNTSLSNSDLPKGTKTDLTIVNNSTTTLFSYLGLTLRTGYFKGNTTEDENTGKEISFGATFKHPPMVVISLTGAGDTGSSNWKILKVSTTSFWFYENIAGIWEWQWYAFGITGDVI
jgi:hypothetical protein